MKVAIVGYALEGKSSCEYFLNQGHSITICDSNESIQDIPEGVEVRLGSDYLANIDQFDLIIRTAGMNPSIISTHFNTNNPPITTNINEFLRACPTKNVIGITGTKGKGTTSTLTAKILEASGKTVHLGGNIGVPALSFLDKIQPDDWVVLELSSFQLQDVTHSPHIAVCLMVVPEHLNWHQDLQDYTSAKSNIFKYQNEGDIAIYFAENETSKSIASHSRGSLIPYYQNPGAHIENDAIVIDGQTICQTNDIRLLGKHNWQNVCAAITAVWQTGIRDIEATRNTIRNFSGLPHRLEFVRSVDGTDFFNDSFAATPDAAIAAIEAIDGKKIIILGGFDRMLPINHLAAELVKKQDEIEKVIAIGKSGERLIQACEDAGFTNYILCDAKTMRDIVTEAKSYATANSSIILSPGFPSFDMFQNFEDRGNQFKDAVTSL